MRNPVHAGAGELSHGSQARAKDNAVEPGSMKNEVALPVEPVECLNDSIFDSDELEPGVSEQLLDALDGGLAGH